MWIEEQTVTTKEIASNMVQASLGIQDVNNNVAEVSSVTGEISKDIAGVNQASTEMDVLSANLDNNAKELRKFSEKLAKVVGHFKTAPSRFDIGKVKSMHLQWRSRLEVGLQGKRVLRSEEVSSDHECDFGRWYFGPEGQALRALPVFSEVGETHRQIRQHIKQIAEQLDKGRKDEAVHLLSEFELCRERFFHVLDNLHQDE